MSKFRDYGAENKSILAPQNRRPVPDGFAELVRGGIFLGPGQEKSSDDFRAEAAESKPYKVKVYPPGPDVVKINYRGTKDTQNPQLAEEIQYNANMAIGRFLGRYKGQSVFDTREDDDDFKQLVARYYDVTSDRAVVSTGRDQYGVVPDTDAEDRYAQGRGNDGDDRIHFTKPLATADADTALMAVIHEILHKMRSTQKMERKSGYNPGVRNDVFWRHETWLNNRAIGIAKRLGLMDESVPMQNWQENKRRYEDSQKNRGGR